ncbi:hypothetical protein ACWD5V_42565 [Streptomyces sp. NPDC002523]
MSVHELIAKLPNADALRGRSQALAALDAALCPDVRFRVFTFTADSPSEGVAEMRDGMGGEYSIYFSGAGVLGRGFDHESPMSPYRSTPPEAWPGLLPAVPSEFSLQLGRRVVQGTDVPLATVVFWNRSETNRWETGDLVVPAEEIEDADGAEGLFALLVEDQPEAFVEFADECYEVQLDPQSVAHFMELKEVSLREVAEIAGEDVAVEELAQEFTRIGYPFRA